MDPAVHAVCEVSRSLRRAIDADPSLVDGLDVGVARDPVEAPDVDDLDALRWWKRRELIRVAARDLAGLVDLAGVGSELASLADACLATAVRLADPQVPFAVVGMGKLGGQELNYASDVDVVFVHRGEAAAATAAARTVIDVMTRPTAAGIVFRTDADLRPEGPAGPLSRTPEAYGEYFARWADAWERQAYMKARFVAGTPDVGRALFDAVMPEIWGRELEAGSVLSIQGLKQRAESLHGASEVKRGPGGIRDVEFSVQLLQLVHGRRDPSVRTRNTLDALADLARAGYVDPGDANHLASGYRYLRTVEHRLQLRDERQVHEVPSDPEDRRWLARVLGYRDVDELDDGLRRHQASVREIHERLFYRPLLHWIAESGDVAPEALGERLRALGFDEPERAASTIDKLTSGLSRPARILRQILPLALDALATSPSPDLGLIRLSWVIDGQFRANTIVPALRESPESVDRLCRLLGSSAFVAHALRRHPEFVRRLTDDIGPRPLPALRAEAEATSDLRRFARREELRIAARDLLGSATVTEVGRELTLVARAALETVTPPEGFAVIGMGRFGAGELSYGSDLDVQFVHTGDPQAADKAARAVLAEIGTMTPEGRVWEIDARLRPDGESGPLSRSLDGFRRYYEERAQLWELQAMLRAAVVAGDADLGEELLAVAAPHVYRDRLSEAERDELRAMKRRVETERRGDVLKLGPGGLVDVEFCVQALQLAHGHADPALRTPSTHEALRALVAGGHLSAEDGRRLHDAYVFCERARNMNFLITGKASDALPDDPELTEVLEQLLEVDDVASAREALCGAARGVVERVFYGP